MNQKDKESMWGGHDSLYATVGCAWVPGFCLATHPALKDAGEEWESRGLALGGGKGKRSGSGLKIPLMGTGEMHNPGRQALILSLAGTAEGFYLPLGACHCDSVCCMGWEVDLEQFRRKCWVVNRLGQTEGGSSCNSTTLSCQSTELLPCWACKTKPNTRRSCAEMLCSCLWQCRFGGAVTTTPALYLMRINSPSEGPKWCSQAVNAFNRCVLHRVFFFNLPHESILERLSQRRTDPITGERWALLALG